VEAQLERATVLARRGDAPAQVRREFDQAIDTLIASRFTGAAVPAGVDRYLELLIAEVKAQPSEDAYNRFFQAMQAVGEPAVARQINKLQAVMTSDPAIGAKFRDRADLEREITRLRYQITSADPATAAELNRQRQTAETKLLSLNAELQNSRLDEAPATVAEVRAALQPDESFLKIAELNRKLYGIAITKDQTFIYAIEPAARFLDAVATELRNSIDGRLGQDKRLVSFNVQAAHSLFKALTGPASARLMQSRALVIDPAGPLSRIPAGVLITDAASVQRYNARRRKDPFNYSDLSFLASQMKIGTAVSPRSFLSLRALPASKGVNPFIGFAEHVPPTTGPQFASAAKIDVGDACSAEFTELRALAQRLRPIDRKEVTIASSALGLPNAPVVAGDEFSDTAIKSRGDLAQYKVLHFATHGLQEGVWGCDRSPPALVTSFGDKNSDGLLSFSEIAELNLDANLVVLSACDTGSGIRNQALARQSGQEEAGATLEGLVRAFLTANSRAVLATHWQVSAEEETDQLIRTFYSTALQQDIGSSLQAAQRQLLKNPRYSHPFYWGAYFVVGDNSKMMLGS
jgi:CHAT domain-containing protein